MANMIVASSKPLIRASSSPIPPKPRLQIPQFSIPKFPAPKILLKSQQALTFSSKTLKSLPIMMAQIPPSLAEGLAAVKEKAERLDLNLLLPILMAQILDERDAEEGKEREERDDAETKSVWAELAAEWSRFRKEIQAKLKEAEEEIKREDAKSEEEKKRLEAIWRDQDFGALEKEDDFKSFVSTSSWFFGGIAGFLFIRLLLELCLISSRAMTF